MWKNTHQEQEMTPLTYSLSVEEFLVNMVRIPTTPLVYQDTNPVSSTYLADGQIFSDISNFISTVDGLIVTWFTPTTLLNLELDSIINGMVTECIV